ncbi:MAG: pyridoxal phosphate-dependent aminotransferase [Acidobacteria bacterium]|nr:pyridoxal phosphate-dependent aminotransferase [Acidobacteriota bacterium]
MRPLASRVGELSGEGAPAVFARARELEAQGRDIIHLELGEPDFHPPAPVIEAAKAALDAGRDRYAPPAGIPSLREALADYLGRTRGLSISPDNFIVAPGCKMILSLCIAALIERGDEVLYPDPGFPIYPSLIRTLGGKPVAFELRESSRFQPDAEEIARKITSRTKALIFNSPNNPTGTVFDARALGAVAQLARENDLYVISDEIYARIVYDVQYESIYAQPGMADRTVIVDGFSKSFAMTGWRLGYAAVPSHMLDATKLLVVNSYTCASEFIQHAAVEALHDKNNSVVSMVGQFRARRDEFIANLNRIPGFRALSPQGAFYAWVNVEGTGMPAEEISRRMLEEAGVGAIPGAAFGAAGKNFIRFSFAASAALLRQATERIAAISSKWELKPQLTGERR